MQKIRKSYWKKFNPVGDTLQCKIAVTQRTTIVGATAIPSVRILEPDWPNQRIPRLNDPVGLMGRLGPADQTSYGGRCMANSSSLLASQIFRRYKCKGVAATVTVTPRFAGSNPSPAEQTRRFIVAAWANSENIVTGRNVSGTGPGTFDFSTVIPEQRWVKWRPIQQGWIYGGKMTKLKFYFNVDRVFGPDRIVKGDADFCGVTDSLDTSLSGFSSSLANRPIIGPGLELLIYALDNQAITASWAFDVQINWTFYVKYFQKYQNTIVADVANLVPI